MTMAATIFHLRTCSTCQRILKDWQAGPGVLLQEIKSTPVDAVQLDAMATLAGSYEALFNRRSMQFRRRGLHEQTLQEQDYRSLILEEYTFLKRPVLWLDDVVFAGNAKATVAAAAEALQARGLA